MKGSARTPPPTVLLAMVLVAGCSRDRNAVMLTAPFNDSTKIGQLTAVWEDAGDERAFAGGTRLAEPEVRFRFRVDAQNRLGDRLFVRLGNFQLVDATGLGLAAADASIACALSAGTTEGVLSGDVWVPKRTAKNVAGFRISHFAVPLSDRGRSLYREWLLQGRAQDAAQIDSEIGRYAAAPPCLASGAGAPAR